MVHNFKVTVCSDDDVTVGMRCSVLGVLIQIGSFSLCCTEPLGVAHNREEAVWTEYSVTNKNGLLCATWADSAMLHYSVSIEYIYWFAFAQVWPSFLINLVFCLQIKYISFLSAFVCFNFTFVLYLDSLFFSCILHHTVAFIIFLNSFVILSFMLPEWPEDDHTIGRNM